MKRALLTACAVASLSHPAGAADWIERYFGVGSAGAATTACGEARSDAHVNATRACVERHGSRGAGLYTDCACTSVADGIHICNVNLKVTCEGPLSSASAQGTPTQRGEPKDRADGRSVATGGRRARTDQPGPKVGVQRDAPERRSWTGGEP